MPGSQSDWDTKHQLAAKAPLSEPASIVRELLPLLPTGWALDVACGAGRHSILLAELGRRVTAVDFSTVALDALEFRARGMHIPVWRQENLHESSKQARRGIALIPGDLEQMELPERTFDLILCIQYLQRSLFAQMARALRSNGVLLMETFTRAQLEFKGGPRNPAYLLETGELREAFPDLCVLFCRELRAGQGIASLVAKKYERHS